MKITWFGGTTFRIYVGGRIFVTDAGKAPGTANMHEVAAAADYRIDLGGEKPAFPLLDAENWRRRKPLRLVDAPAEEVFDLYTLSGEAIFIDEPEEGPVVLAPARDTAWGRFADDAVLILHGDAEALAEGVRSVTAIARPRLIAIAAPEMDDAQVQAIAGLCGGCAIQVLERGLPLEV